MSRVAKRKFEGNASDPQKELLSLIKSFGYRHSTNDVFSDFVEMSALAISNAVDRHHYEPREKRENTTDGYHFPIVHKSWMSSVDEETSEMLSS